MANTTFNAKITPNSSTQLTVNTFQISASIFDGAGVFSGFDVMVGDIVFLDTFSSVTAPSSISKYTVSSVVSLGVSIVNIVLTYSDSGTEVDPGEVLGNPGFISRPSSVDAFAYHAAPTLHNIPDYVVQYARNQETFSKIDGNLGGGGGGGGSSNEELFTNNSGASIPAYSPVKQNTSGDISTIDPSVESEVLSAIGVTKQSIANGVEDLVVMSGLIKDVSLGFSIGDIIYLSKTGTLTNVVPDIGVGGFLESDFVLRVGKITKNSTNPSDKDLLVNIELVGGL